MTPLPAVLRRDIILLAERRCDDSTELNKVLLQYSREYDASVRTTAESAYYSALKRRGEINSNTDETLTNELLSVGPNNDALRQSAFAGVITCERLHLFKNLATHSDNKPLTISVLDDYKANPVLIEMTATHWDYISLELGTDRFTRLNLWGRNDVNNWNSLSPFLNKSDSLKEEFINYCRNTTSCLTSNSLQTLANLKVDQLLLKNHCKRIINKRSKSSLEDVLASQTAGQILGTQFSEDVDLEKFLTPLLSYHSDGAIIALSLAFPNNSELQGTHNNLVQSKQFNSSWAAALYLVSACGDVSFFERVVTKRLSLPNLGYWGFHSNCVDPIIRRLAKDKQAYSKFFDRLNTENTPAYELASIPRLLALSSSGDEELYDWCKMEITKQMANRELPDSGFDLVTGRVRPILHSLFEILINYGL